MFRRLSRIKSRVNMMLYLMMMRRLKVNFIRLIKRLLKGKKRLESSTNK